jgi:REP element-mobilizing transposase RayT
MGVKEKRHRLPKEFYRGEMSVTFTLCIRKDVVSDLKVVSGVSVVSDVNVVSGFSLSQPKIVNTFTEILSSTIEKAGCIVPVYCFMPDHQHLMITGIRGDSDIWKVVVSYKQKRGFWMSANKPGMRWQKDFYDHIIRTNEDVASQIRYILDNPVRKGLVTSWEDYPFKGSVGCRLEDVLLGII